MSFETQEIAAGELYSNSNKLLLTLRFGYPLLCFIASAAALFNELLSFPLFVVVNLVSIAFVILSIPIILSARVRNNGVWFATEILYLLSLFYLLDGAYNPFISIILLPLAISAIIARRVTAWSLAMLSVLGYLFLLLYYQPLSASQVSHIPHSHIWGMWLSFSLAAFVIVYALSFLSLQLRAKQEHLMKLRERQIRHEQMIGLGAMAAHSAHNLGTPINSIILLSEELAELNRQDTIVPIVEELQQSVNLCRDAIVQLSKQAQMTVNKQVEKVSFELFWQHLMTQFSLLQPEFKVKQDGIDIDCLIADSPVLSAAFLNLMNNSAQASLRNGSSKLAVTISKDSALNIGIQDFGTGYDGSLEDKLGRQALDSDSGMGVGLVLANASIELFHGQVRLQNNEFGCLTSVTLPV